MKCYYKPLQLGKAWHKDTWLFCNGHQIVLCQYLEETQELNKIKLSEVLLKKIVGELEI